MAVSTWRVDENVMMSDLRVTARRSSSGVSPWKPGLNSWFRRPGGPVTWNSSLVFLVLLLPVTVSRSAPKIELEAGGTRTSLYTKPPMPNSTGFSKSQWQADTPLPAALRSNDEPSPSSTRSVYPFSISAYTWIIAWRSFTIVACQSEQRWVREHTTEGYADGQMRTHLLAWRWRDADGLTHDCEPALTRAFHIHPDALRSAGLRGVVWRYDVQRSIENVRRPRVALLPRASIVGLGTLRQPDLTTLPVVPLIGQTRELLQIWSVGF